MVVGPTAQQPADSVERVVTAAAVPGLLALDAASHVVDGGEAQAHDVEAVQHPHRATEHGAQRGGVAAVGIQRGYADSAAPGRIPVIDPAHQRRRDRPATTSSNRAGPRPRVRSTMPVTKLVERVAEAA